MKKILITLGVLLGICIILCFVPFNADKFIPLLKNQIESQYGITIDTQKLIIKFGPSIIIKSPKVDMKYNKSEHFASLSGVKIKLAILPLIKNEARLKELRIDNTDLIFKTDKNGDFVIQKYLKPVDTLNVISKIRLKKYSKTITDYKGQNYCFSGSELLISDFQPNKHVRLESKGKLLIDNIKHIDYDISLICDGINFNRNNTKLDIMDFLAQIKEKQANASIVADLRIKNNDGKIKTDGSLSIDKLTFVMNGVKLPYSFASFTMLGNKTSVSSVIYTNSTNKISVNGYFTNSENPAFNMAIKSNEINLKDLLYFARLFSDISNLDQIKDINGTLYSDFVLKGTLKRLKSNGIFKINNANIYTDKVSVTNLNSDIDFNDNKILIKTAKAFINSAPVIITGEIISNKLNINLIVNKFKLKNISYDNCKINNGILSVIANLSGSYKNIIPRIEAELNNVSGSYDTAKFKFNRLIFKSADKHSGEIAVANMVSNLPQMQPLTVPILKAHLSDTDINVEPFTFYSGNTKVDIWGKVLNYNNNDKLTFSFIGSGFINPKGMFKIAELDNVYPVFMELSGDNDIQLFNAQALEQRSNAKISFAQPVIMNLSAKCSNKEVKIVDCSVNTYKGIFTQNLRKNIAASSKLCVITGGIENLRYPVLKNVKLNFTKTCPVNIDHYMAKINGNLIINGDILKPEIIGNIKLPILSDKYGCMTAKNITLALTKNIINFDCANVKVFDSALSFVGTADADFSKDLTVKTLNVKSKDFDLDNMSLLLMMSKDAGVNINIENGSMFSERVQIQTPVEPVIITDMNSSFKIKNNTLNINDLNASMYNGKVAGHINMNTAAGTYTGLIQGRGVSAGPVMKSMTNLKENVSGKLDFDMDINSSIKSKFLKNANLKFIIRDGQMSTLGKVEHLLYAQNIVADNMLKTSLAVITRAISSKDTGLFKYLNGIMVINDDVVNIKSMKMLGPNMSLYITGHYGLMSNIANVTILGRLSNTMVSSLGSFGTFTMDKFRIALTGENTEEARILQAGVENIPQLPQRNTKEFKAVISGPAEAKTSVRSFMWISESEKEYRTREIQQSNVGIPKFIENLPY